MLELGVNIDHIATVREARKASFPNPLDGALLAETVGAWGITAHLREDRRHINDRDMEILVANVKRLNMEMAVTDEMVGIASRLKPHSCCLVPEKRQELTTEGGLDVLGNFDAIKAAVEKLQSRGIIISIFIDPDIAQIKAVADSGSEYIELHTGSYANSSGGEQRKELDRLIAGAEYADSVGLKVNAGHGIDYDNINGILEIPNLCELNIGHSIVARSIITGISTAVSEMIDLMRPYNI